MKWLRWFWSLLGGAPAPAPDFVMQAQAKTVELCGFLPAASTVTAIVGAMTGQAAAAATIVGVATTICKAVSTAKLTSSLVQGEPLKPLVVIEGVEITVEGTFVNK